uniref:Uncharacterized protein n=1 Tax=Arundo donax TaxID=35708 RepID=A0A0A9B2K1_ARUDO
MPVFLRSHKGPDNKISMSLVWSCLAWDVTRNAVKSGLNPEALWETSEEDQEGCYSDSPKPEQSTARWNRGKPGHVSRKRRRRP